MLQQTRVQTVLPYYRRFIRRFPGIRALAAAPEPEVLQHWAGLGYYSRASNLKKAAAVVLSEHAGRFPDTFESARKLPGVGRYIAGAVLSIARNQPHPVVEGNVRRVIRRLHGLAGSVPERHFWSQAAAWTPDDRPAEFNQAVMELGALVCTPSHPRCADCPVASMCAARSAGTQHSIPPPRKVRPVETVRLAILVVEKNGRVLLSSRPAIGFVPGKWGLPAVAIGERETPDQAAERLCGSVLERAVSLRAGVIVRHGITHRNITAHVFHVDAGRPEALQPRNPELHWIARPGLGPLLVSSLYRKAAGLTPTAEGADRISLHPQSGWPQVAPRSGARRLAGGGAKRNPRFARRT